MSPVQMIHSLLNSETLQKASIVSLKPGQLLYGRVEKLLPNDTAIIQIGNMRLFAHLKASLSASDSSYWFEVRTSGNDGIELKVLEGTGQANRDHLFLKNLQLPETKQNLQLLQFFSIKNLPITKEQLMVAASWMSNQTDMTKELTALEWMMNKNLPFSKQTFQSLVAVQESQSFYHQLEKLSSYLDHPSFESLKTIQPLQQMITSILGKQSMDDLDTGKAVQHMLKNLVQSLGLEYEKEVQLWANDKQDSLEPLHSLKPLLMNAITELGTNGKELEPLLTRLTGMQLISQDPFSSMMQMVMQLPLSIGGKQSDITLQWSGRKTNKGQIDPHYCRIIFYLDLQSLEQTVIDMQIQNKVIHFSVINEKKEIEPIIKALTPALKEKLERAGYTLSFIHVNPSFEKIKTEQQQINPIHLSKGSYQRVDMKV